MAPAADVDPRVPVCGQRTWGTDGMEYRCTRPPQHPDDFHQAVYDRYRTDGPVGHVGLVWEDNHIGAGGPTAADPLAAITITVTAPRSVLERTTVERVGRDVLDVYDEGDHDYITIATNGPVSPVGAVSTAAQTALTALLVLVANADTAYEVAPHLQCVEADAFAELLRTEGHHDAAAIWLHAHAATDDDGDSHDPATGHPRA
jgi:hypothetical protein